jgi:pimeloyl-ACP methyl ester carboxylesterase
MSRNLPRTIFAASSCLAIFVTPAILPLAIATAQTELVATQETASLLGGGRAQGAVIWSHGRSLQTECARAPTPDYVEAFRAAAWDTFRLNRPRSADTLIDSGAALANAADALRQRGYRRVVLAGQSFGAFLSLIAAGRSDAVDVVIGIAPAAYGSLYSNPAGYGLNAARLYDLLGAVPRARVALFFFEDDVFDPGGRAPVADQILAAHGLAHLVIDRPAGLPTHWAGAGPAFAARYARCLVAFAGEKMAGITLACPDSTASAQAPAASGPTRPTSDLGIPRSVVDLQVGRWIDVGGASRRR